MFENKPREIKFKIGVKEYDKKVHEFYTLLVKSVDSYTNPAIIGAQLFWDAMLFDQFTDEDAVIQIQKRYKLLLWDKVKIQKYIDKLSWIDEVKYSADTAATEFEFMCFAKALVFYLSKQQKHLLFDTYIY